MKHFTKGRIRDLLEAVKLEASESLESETVEFKEYRDERALHNSKDLAEELSALANKRGGVVVVGVRDSSNVQNQHWDSQLVGIPEVDLLETQQRLTGKLSPSIELFACQLDFEGKNYLAIEITHPSDTLVSTTSGKTCIRDGRSSRPMKPDELRDAVKGLTTYDWSGEIIDGDPLQLLDTQAADEAVADFAQHRGIAPEVGVEAYLEAIGATRNGNLTAGGLLFLGRSSAIRLHLGEYEYRFSWKTRSGSLLVNDVWADCLWNTIRRARRFFDQCNESRNFTHRSMAFQVPLLDSTVFHEAYLNAVVHRDYSHDGMVSVTHMGRQLVVTSPGGFYGGVTAENIALHEPRHRNKTLAKIMMGHHLVDRAGMGVLRMGIRSLAYGRGLPSFNETYDNVEVRMDAEYFRPLITSLFLNEPERFGIVDLVILNHCYETGAVAVPALERFLSPLIREPWEAIQQSVKELEWVELCGRRDGIFVRVEPALRDQFEVKKSLRITQASSKHVKVYTLLKQHDEASNADVRDLLGHNHSSQTSKFLRDASYVQRQGSGMSSRWSLIDPGSS